MTLEGGIYALISTLLIMTFGNAFLMLVADAVPHMANYAVFKYPVALVIGLIAVNLCNLFKCSCHCSQGNF